MGCNVPGNCARGSGTDYHLFLCPAHLYEDRKPHVLRLSVDERSVPLDRIGLLEFKIYSQKTRVRGSIAIHAQQLYKDVVFGQCC
jgi:hypothetical protein